MTRPMLLLGQILIAFAVVIGGWWLATQWAAAEAYWLGLPWFVIFSLPVYCPRQLLEWWYAYNAYAPSAFDEAGIIAETSGFARIVVAVAGSLLRARPSCLVAKPPSGPEQAGALDLMAARPARMAIGEDRWVGRRLTECLQGDPGERRRHQFLMMLDQFPALGRLDLFETALAFITGCGIRAYLIAQSLKPDLQGLRRDTVIFASRHVCIAFFSNDERIAGRISDALGMATELRAQRNYAGHWLAPGAAACHGQPAGDGAPAPHADELVLVSGVAPIRTKRLRYYEDRNFTRAWCLPSAFWTGSIGIGWRLRC
jgi:type IV secretory pathway TraG/TraD family ATPase VirD4